MTAPPLCRYCGKPIAKATRRVQLTLKRTEYQKDHGEWSRYIEVPAFPQSKAECQKLTNWTVVSVSWVEVYDVNYNMMPKTHIDIFSEWDGKSYAPIDGFFCTGNHARDFGRLMAQGGHGTKAYNEAVRKRREKEREKAA